MPLEVLGIWIGSPAKLQGLRREGIFRFLQQLTGHLLADYPLRIEVWCQEFNLPQVRELFAELASQPGVTERIVFCTERNAARRFPGKGATARRCRLALAGALVHGLKTSLFRLKDLFKKYGRLLLLLAALLAVSGIYLAFRSSFSRGSRAPFFILPGLALLLLGARVFRRGLEGLAFRAWEYFKLTLNVLPRAANWYSEADCFLVQNFDLANAWTLRQLKIVNLHDLFTTEFAPLFSRSGFDRRRLFQGENARRSAERLAAGDSFFVCNSDHIRREHALAMIPGLMEKRTAFIFLPAIIPEGIREKIGTRSEVLSSFPISGDYIFYPTHVRPYKNILTLLRALSIVRDRGCDLSLVLTGDLSRDPACAAFAEQNDLWGRIVLTRDLSELEMYGLYRHAALTAVTTLSEGGFPWQALEAMAMGTPVVMSRIPVVEERLLHHGLSSSPGALQLFAPLDENDLAERILFVWRNREQVRTEQEVYRQKLLAYDWHQLSAQYHRLFEDLLSGASHD